MEEVYQLFTVLVEGLTLKLYIDVNIFTTGIHFQQSQLREQPLIQLCNHKCFPSISNIFRTWHFIMGSKKLPLLKTHIFLKTILKIVVAVVVNSFDEFC